MHENQDLWRSTLEYWLFAFFSFFAQVQVFLNIKSINFFIKILEKMVIAFVDCQVIDDKVIDLPIKNKKFPSELKLPINFIFCKNTFNLTCHDWYRSILLIDNRLFDWTVIFTNSADEALWWWWRCWRNFEIEKRYSVGFWRNKFDQKSKDEKWSGSSTWNWISHSWRKDMEDVGKWSEPLRSWNRAALKTQYIRWKRMLRQ